MSPSDSFVGVTCLRCTRGAEYVRCEGPGPGWNYTDIGAAVGWLCPDCTRAVLEELQDEVRDLETALVEARKLGPGASNLSRKREEDVLVAEVIRDRSSPPTDRMTPRMQARVLIDALDRARAER